jgi:manganese/zinc/iron transport system substrate-binding protein
MKQIYFALILVFLIAGTGEVHGREPIKVVTTIGQITDIVKNVGGDKVLVSGLMGPGVDPHLYKASESDVMKLSNAEIIFYNGLFLEAKMESIFEHLEKNRGKKAVPVAQAISSDALLESETLQGHHDPHVWFDILLWTQAAKRVAETLIEFDPQNKAYYEDRYKTYELELQKLHEYTNSKSAELSKEERILVTAHDAFRYFGRRYDFKVVGLQGISTESQAGTKDVKELADFIVANKVPAIFVESSVPERNIRAVMEAVKSRGWDVKIGGELFSDAMGNAGTFEGTYQGMITHNIDTIVNSLKNKGHYDH